MGNYKVMFEGKELVFSNVKFMVSMQGTMFLKGSQGKTVFATSSQNVIVMEIE